MSWPAIVLWALIPLVAISRGPAALYATSVAGAFMSLQMLPGDGLSMNLLPQTVFAAALVGKIALQRGNLLRAAEAALDPARLGLFTAFIVFSILTAIVLPRLFAGLIEVIPVAGADLTGASVLTPRSGNITQTAYMLVSYFTAVAIAVIGSRRDVRQYYLQALLWGGLAIVATGVVDLAAYHAGASALLDPFRTASYSLLTDVEAEGAKRVVGFTPEASSYGGISVGAAASILFLRPLYRAGAHRLLATATMLGLLAMGALSTSATAYAGSAVLACVYLFDLARRLLDRQAFGRDALVWEIGILAVAALIGCAVVALAPGKVAPAFDVLDKVVFSKSESYSYYQRSLWTHTGWLAFLELRRPRRRAGIGANVELVGVDSRQHRGVRRAAAVRLHRAETAAAHLASVARGRRLRNRRQAVAGARLGDDRTQRHDPRHRLRRGGGARPVERCGAGVGGTPVDPSAAAPQPAQSAARTASPRRRRRVGRPALFWRDPSLSPHAGGAPKPLHREAPAQPASRTTRGSRIASRRPPRPSTRPLRGRLKDEVGGRSLATTQRLIPVDSNWLPARSSK